MVTSESSDKYSKANEERRKYVDTVLASKSPKKIVVAGPGTGKTYLFKRVLEGKKKALTLTFVNSLIEDLSIDLCGLSEVRTLHSFALGIVGKVGMDVSIFPRLSEVIGEDAQLLLGQDIDFDAILHDRDDRNKLLGFYHIRRDYYQHYGHADVVFECARLFEQEPETIPTYEQVLVDEFQDFNKLEVSLIDALAAKSPVLIAGDDDQALYAFKKASAEHIREKHGAADPDYESFTLPFCSRCTRVIVAAVNDLIESASAAGFLKNRIAKEYKYLDDTEKDKDSEHYPHIGYSQLFSGQIPWFIAKQIDGIARDTRQKFSVLVISPTSIQCRSIAEALRDKGFQSVAYHDRQSEKEALFFDGLMLLLEDNKSNLGWRIVGQTLLSVQTYQDVMQESFKNGKALFDLVPADCKNVVKDTLTTLRAVRDSKPVDETRLSAALNKTHLDPHRLAREALVDEISHSQHLGNPGIRKVPIKVSTIPSSKGLAEDYVFITHFDDDFYGGTEKRKLTDQDICNLLVALTRARKKVFLISSKKVDPTLLKWIKPERINRL